MKRSQRVMWTSTRFLWFPALLCISSVPALADTYSGLVTGLQIVDTGSMQFRVTLNTTMTNCSLNFAFVEPSSTVFSSYVAGLTTAYSVGKPVSLQVNREAGGYWRIYFASY